eukprot:6435289-Lingulodinium_polyedra.AAC.1
MFELRGVCNILLVGRPPTHAVLCGGDGRRWFSRPKQGGCLRWRPARPAATAPSPSGRGSRGGRPVTARRGQVERGQACVCSK